MIGNVAFVGLRISPGRDNFLRCYSCRFFVEIKYAHRRALLKFFEFHRRDAPGPWYGRAIMPPATAPILSY